MILILAGCLLGCQQYPDPSIEPLISYSFDKSGSDQKALAGDYLVDSIGFRIYNNLNNHTDEQLRINFEIIKGGGAVDQPVIITEINGSAFTKWKLGDQPGEQMVRARVVGRSNKLLSDIYFKAYGFKDDVWNAVTLEPDKNMRDIAVDTSNHLTFMTTNNLLYRQGYHYFDWEEIQTVNIEAPRIVEIDSEGTLYVGNWNGDLSKSPDHGKTWISCPSPMAGSTNFRFTVTSDNYIWANALGYPLHYSKDGGRTWAVDSVGLGTRILLQDIFRLKDGSYWMCGLITDLHKPDIFRSDGIGKSWAPAQTPGDPAKLYVSPKDEIIISSYYEGFSLLKSDDQGQHYTRIYHSGTGSGLYMGGFIQKAGDHYYALIPGEGILKGTDLNAFKLYWYNPNLVSLFMDHNGVLIAKQSNNRKVFYRRNSD